MAKHGSILLVMVTLALADLGNACIQPVPDLRIYNDVEGFNAEGYVIWSPENCEDFVKTYGTSNWPFPPPAPPYDIFSPYLCSYPALDYVSVKISRNSETIYCEAYIDDSDYYSDNYCDLHITGLNDNETGKLTCKVEKWFTGCDPYGK